MSDPPNHYHVLGLSPPVTTDQVRASYVRLLKLQHPDRTHTGPPSQRLQQLQRAYQTLRDPERRADHDRLLLDRERRYRAGMRTARRRIRRMDQSALGRRRALPWAGRLMLVSAGALLLVVARLGATL